MIRLSHGEEGEEFKPFKSEGKFKFRYAISNFGRLLSFTDTFENGTLLKGSNENTFSFRNKIIFALFGDYLSLLSKNSSHELSLRINLCELVAKYKSNQMKKISIIGNVTKDAEVRAFEGGKSVINFDVAVNERYKDKSGQKVERTSFFRCSKWAENTTIAQYIIKGTKLYVEGLPEADAYINKEGKAVGNIKINVREIEFLGSAKKTETGGSSPAEDSLVPSTNDDLPF